MYLSHASLVNVFSFMEFLGRDASDAALDERQERKLRGKIAREPRAVRVVRAEHVVGVEDVCSGEELRAELALDVEAQVSGKERFAGIKACSSVGEVIVLVA